MYVSHIDQMIQDTVDIRKIFPLSSSKKSLPGYFHTQGVSMLPEIASGSCSGGGSM